MAQHGQYEGKKEKREKRKEIRGKGNRGKDKGKSFLRKENWSTTAAETKRKQLSFNYPRR